MYYVLEANTHDYILRYFSRIDLVFLHFDYTFNKHHGKNKYHIKDSSCFPKFIHKNTLFFVLSSDDHNIGLGFLNFDSFLIQNDVDEYAILKDLSNAGISMFFKYIVSFDLDDDKLLAIDKLNPHVLLDVYTTQKNIDKTLFNSLTDFRSKHLINYIKLLDHDLFLQMFVLFMNKTIAVSDENNTFNMYNYVSEFYPFDYSNEQLIKTLLDYINRRDISITKIKLTV